MNIPAAIKNIVLFTTVLCLNACGNRTVDGINEESKDFSLLGVQMGNSYEDVKQVIEGKVADCDINEAIIIKDQQVGPTRFHEIKFEFESFRGKSALKEIEMYAELDKEEARYFTYFWNKEFESKYECRCKTLDRVIECRNLYHINDSKIVSVDVEKFDYSYYRCTIEYYDWYAGDKVYEGINDRRLDDYFKKADENKYVFTEY